MPAERDVVIVGGGAVGLLIANELSQHIPPNSITVIDRDPPPTPTDLGYLGTTFGGKDARQGSIFESEIVALPENVSKLTTPTSEYNGWMALEEGELNENERRWIEKFEEASTNPEVIERNREILKLQNKMGLENWFLLMKNRPELFENAGLDVSRPEEFKVPMFYRSGEEDRLEKDMKEEKELGVPVAKVLPDEIARLYPSLLPALDKGKIIGGYAGPTFAIYARTLFTNIAADLKREGVEFLHNTTIKHIEKNEHGEVEHLVGLNGKIEMIQGTNYIISPGVPGDRMLDGTEYDDQVMGMAGGWIIVPTELSPLTPNAYKGSFWHLNVTPHVEDRYNLFSGGYGFVGEHGAKVEMPGIQAMMKGLAQELSSIHHQFEDIQQFDLDVCERPMTADQLPNLGTVPAKNKGKLIVAGGNGAGGFTQGPAMAKAVLNELGIKMTPEYSYFKKT